MTGVNHQAAPRPTVAPLPLQGSASDEVTRCVQVKSSGGVCLPAGGPPPSTCTPPCTTVLKQTALTAHLKSQRLLLFVFASRSGGEGGGAGEGVVDDYRLTGKHETFTQCCFKVGTLSLTAAQH